MAEEIEEEEDARDDDDLTASLVRLALQKAGINAGWVDSEHEMAYLISIGVCQL